MEDDDGGGGEEIGGQHAYLNVAKFMFVFCVLYGL